MLTPSIDITWFDEDEWLGREIAFSSPTETTWRVDQKLLETANYEEEYTVKLGRYERL